VGVVTVRLEFAAAVESVNEFTLTECGIDLESSG
jgi:hypothetical protein